MKQARLTREEKKKLSINDVFIEYCRENPCYAAKVLLGAELVWFQRWTLRMMWTHQFFLLVWGRGTGKTYIGALFAVLYALLYPGAKVGIVAPVFRQSEFVFEEIEKLYEESPYFQKSVIGKKILHSPSRCYVKFANGSSIEALPIGNGAKVRGRRYNVALVDEYAQMDPEVLKFAIGPMLAIRRRGRANKVIEMSSAFFTWNHLYHRFLFFKLKEMEKVSLYASSVFNYEDLLEIDNPPYVPDLNYIEQQRASMTDDEFAMEWLARFPVGTSGFFPAQLIHKCTPKRNEGSPIELQGRKDREYVLGIDAARVLGGDDFCIQILRLDGGHNKRLVNCITKNGATFPEMAELIREVIIKYNVVRIFLDSQGGGMALYDLLSMPWEHPETKKPMLPILDMEDKANDARDGLKYLKLVKPTKQVNNDMFNGLKAEMQHGRLFFPITFRKSDLNEIESAYNEIQQTKSQLMLLKAEGKGAYLFFDVPSGKKMDRATALALANSAAKDVTGTPQAKHIELPTEGLGWVEIRGNNANRN